MSDIPAILLAGGLGTRLRDVTNDQIPKSLAEVAGKTILEHVLENLIKGGVKNSCLAVGHKAEQIEEFFGQNYNSLRLSYSREMNALGTGGAALRASIQNNWNIALVVNADTYVEIPLDTLSSILGNSFDAVILGTHVADVSRYGAINAHDKKVKSFAEKGRGGPGFIYAGVALVNFEKLKRRFPNLNGTFSLENDVLTPLAAIGRLGFLEAKSKFIDIGTTESFHAGQKMLKNE